MFLSIALTFAGPLYQEIDFRPPIARVPVVMKDLAVKTGTKLEVGGKLTDEVVCVIAEKRTPKEIMDQMAFALDATWVKQGDRFILERGSSWEKTLEDRRAQAMLKLIEKSLKTVPSRNAVPYDEVIAFATKGREERDRTKMMSIAGMAKLSVLTPAGNLLDEILAALTPERIAREAADHRVVYATDPTAMQRPLPAKLDKAFDRFVERHNALTKLIAPTVPSDGPRFGSNVYDTWKPVDRASMKVLFTVSRQADIPSIRVRVFQDRQLAVVADRYLQPLGIEQREVPAIGRVPLSDRSRAFLAKNADGSTAVKDPSLQKELRKPTLCEVLAFGNQEGFGELQKRSGKPLVAVISDELMARSYLVDENGQLKMEVFEGALSWFKTAKQEHDGWDVWKPEGAPSRMSRRSLEAAFTWAGEEGRVSLDNWAELISQDRFTAPRAFSEVFALVGLEVSSEWVSTPGLVRLQAQLTKEQKAQPALDLPPSELTKGQLREISEELYDRGARSMTNYVKNPQSVGDGLGSEPTEYLPNGIADPFRLKVERESGAAWFVEMRWDNYKDVRRYDVGHGAFEEAAVERPDLFPASSTHVPLRAKKFYKGTATRRNFRFDVNQFFEKQGWVSDEVIDRSRVYKWEELPEDFRTELTRQKKEMIESAIKSKANGGGSAKIPPPWERRLTSLHLGLRAFAR